MRLLVDGRCSFQVHDCDNCVRFNVCCVGPCLESSLSWICSQSNFPSQVLAVLFPSYNSSFTSLPVLWNSIFPSPSPSLPPIFRIHILSSSFPVSARISASSAIRCHPFFLSALAYRLLQPSCVIHFPTSEIRFWLFPIYSIPTYVPIGDLHINTKTADEVGGRALACWHKWSLMLEPIPTTSSI